MANFVSLLNDRGKISRQEFHVRLNEISLGLPQNLGRGFLEWFCESIHARSAKFQAVTPEIMESWLGGAHAPTAELRDEFLSVAHFVVKGESISEKEFLSLVRYSKDYMDKWFDRKDPSIITWANDYFFHRITLLTPTEMEAARAWFTDTKEIWRFIPRHWLRMMTVRVVAEAASEVIMRDDFGTYQEYIQIK